MNNREPQQTEPDGTRQHKKHKNTKSDALEITKLFHLNLSSRYREMGKDEKKEKLAECVKCYCDNVTIKHLLLTEIIFSSVCDYSFDHEIVVDFLLALQNENKLSINQLSITLSSVINGISEREEKKPEIMELVASVLATAIGKNVFGFDLFAMFMDNGHHYPLLLILLQHLHKQFGCDFVVGTVIDSKVDLMNSLALCDQNESRLIEILNDRNLNFLTPFLELKSQRVDEDSRKEKSVRSIFQLQHDLLEEAARIKKSRDESRMSQQIETTKDCEATSSGASLSFQRFDPTMKQAMLTATEINNTSVFGESSCDNREKLKSLNEFNNEATSSTVFVRSSSRPPDSTREATNSRKSTNLQSYSTFKASAMCKNKTNQTNQKRCAAEVQLETIRRKASRRSTNRYARSFTPPCNSTSLVHEVIDVSSGSEIAPQDVSTEATKQCEKQKLNTIYEERLANIKKTGAVKKKLTDEATFLRSMLRLRPRIQLSRSALECRKKRNNSISRRRRRRRMKLSKSLNRSSENEANNEAANIQGCDLNPRFELVRIETQFESLFKHPSNKSTLQIDLEATSSHSDQPKAPEPPLVPSDESILTNISLQSPVAKRLRRQELTKVKVSREFYQAEVAERTKYESKLDSLLRLVETHAELFTDREMLQASIEELLNQIELKDELIDRLKMNE